MENILSSEQMSGVWVYETDTGNEKGLFADKHGHINALSFSPDGKKVASGGFSNPIIQIWELASGKKLNNFRFTSETNSISGLAFSEDGSKVIMSQTWIWRTKTLGN